MYTAAGEHERFADVEPEWLNCGPLDTQGIEGDHPSEDIPESWAWTLSDTALNVAAIEAELRGSK